ncbi:deoxyguanosinetriphosphate triphosphohydrolase [uncultured Kocuria sp.]|uniref:deoxyguanosinetriphosphate triphosphohydrolase n=1 Tax=uncultured Kocuria sp. TaxID=259305 RepID=UPI002591341A|nr:deoxyguanosinetriphosphate triphosphohydrolase [uncultured Kocuria sp.]MCT1366571.1 deoxyguanosinetriphosphate triphosphohydrolase [Rothia sp. p3-SID1597]
MSSPMDPQQPGYTAHDSERWLPENHKNLYRSHFERDRARVLHSSALRRLGFKTQVVSPNSDDFIRTRLTHSLEVAQVGREVGRMIGCDPDVVDAACLAHDLGHPPFGHNGETALNAIAESAGGFEGNAQTLRLLSRLEPKVTMPDGQPCGLNLTRASLDAACKYPWKREDAPVKDGVRSKKFGVYEDDLPVFEWFRDGAPEGQKCLEAQVMDLADDISYSVHDVEDAVFAGHVQLGWMDRTAERERVLSWTQRLYLPDAEPSELEEALGRLRNLKEWLPSMTGTRASMAELKALTSRLIGRFAGDAIAATRAEYGDGRLTRYDAQLRIPRETLTEIAVMKGIATAFVMAVRDQGPMYENQREMLTVVVEALVETDGMYLDPVFAADWRETDPSDDAGRLRLVIDQVASLTDSSAVRLHDRITGLNWRTGDKPLW